MAIDFCFTLSAPDYLSKVLHVSYLFANLLHYSAYSILCSFYSIYPQVFHILKSVAYTFKCFIYLTIHFVYKQGIT